MQPPLGSPAPAQSRDETMQAEDRRQPLRLGLGHSRRGAAVSSGERAVHSPFFPPSAVLSMPEETAGNVTSAVPTVPSHREEAS